jgi:hypothetical protein
VLPEQLSLAYCPIYADARPKPDSDLKLENYDGLNDGIRVDGRQPCRYPDGGKRINIGKSTSEG